MKQKSEIRGQRSGAEVGGDVAPTAETKELQRLLEADRQRRVAACQTAIAAALEQYRCQLTAAPGITEDGRIGAQVMLRAVE